MPEPRGTIRNVLVLGGAGYLGAVLTRQLLEAGYRVRLLDAFMYGDEGVAGLPGEDRLEVLNADIRDLRAVSAALEGMDAAILLAGLVGAPACAKNPHEAAEINLAATLAVAHAARIHGVQRFLYASSVSVYGLQEGVIVENSPLKPTSLYARLKVESEQGIMRLSHPTFSACALRMATLYGHSPRMRFDLVINVLTRDALLKNKITIFGGAQWRPFLHVADAAAAFRLALEAPHSAVGGQTFNVGSNEQNYRLGDVRDLFRKLFPQVEVKTVPQAPDLRDFQVCFDKIGGAIGYRVRFTVEDGIQEVKEAIVSGRIADPFDKRYINA